MNENTHDFLCIVDEPAGWAYVSVPKCACTSIRRALERHFDLPPAENPHGRPWPLLWSFRQVAHAENCFRWAIARNPLDRLVSVWVEKCQRLPAELVPDLPEHLRACHGKPFERFIRAVCAMDVDSIQVDQHVRSMTWYLTDAAGRPLVDVVYDFAQLADAWTALQSRFGLPPLPHENQTEHGPYARYYTRRLEGLVRTAYARDFQNYFGADA